MGLRLGIDLDGVVADFNGGWIRRYNDEFGTDLAVADAVAWRAPVALTHFDSMRQFWRWARTAGGDRSLFAVLDPYPGAIDAVSELARRHHVVVVTTKPHFAVHDTFAWLAEQRFPTREVHIVDDKTTVPCDVYLDDGPHNIEALAARRPEAVTCRWIQPWNEPVPGVVDVADWGQFRTVVDRVGAALG